MTTSLEWLKENKLDGLVVPMGNRFLSEYIPDSDNAVKYLTGFTGSYGLVIILDGRLIFFTDGRYVLQAKDEVTNADEIINISDITPLKWLESQNLEDKNIAIDGTMVSAKQLDSYNKIIDNLHVISNLLSELGYDNSVSNYSTPFDHDVKYSGESSSNKMARVTKFIKENDADALYIADPENVAWLTNMRGGDLNHTPIILSHAILYQSGKLELYSDNPNLDNSHKIEALKKLDVRSLLLDKSLTCAEDVQKFENQNIKLKYITDPITKMKAIKNDVQIQGMKDAHIRDGAALTKLINWLKDYDNVAELDEIKVSDKLYKLRAENENYIAPSFPTICGFASNGAIIHYHSTESSNKQLQQGNLLLIDSGGQYLDGTTDVTRTIAIGKPTQKMRKYYTLVLKGHIALAKAIFPKGTTGAQLDILARQFLWDEGLDYDHGTGHGVGHCLGVHEGPQSISKRYNNTPLEVGMILSNEPGIYIENEFGIRIESLVAVQQHKNPNFLCFETLTKVPFDEDLIDIRMLSEEEKSWIECYSKNLST